MHFCTYLKYETGWGSDPSGNRFSGPKKSSGRFPDPRLAKPTLQGWFSAEPKRVGSRSSREIRGVFVLVSVSVAGGPCCFGPIEASRGCSPFRVPEIFASLNSLLRHVRFRKHGQRERNAGAELLGCSGECCWLWPVLIADCLGTGFSSVNLGIGACIDDLWDHPRLPFLISCLGQDSMEAG